MAEQQKCPKCGAETFTDHVGIVKHVAVNGDILLEYPSLMYCHGRQSVQADDKARIAELECATKTWLEPCNRCDGGGWIVQETTDIEPGENPDDPNGPPVAAQEQVECGFCFGSGYVHRGLPKGLFAREKHIDELEAIVDKLPKTADGVMVSPGDKVWTLNYWLDNEVMGWEAYMSVGVEGDMPINECYSTREAATGAEADAAEAAEAAEKGDSDG